VMITPRIKCLLGKKGGGDCAALAERQRKRGRSG
jgi:hypothetical protein